MPHANMTHLCLAFHNITMVYHHSRISYNIDALTSQAYFVSCFILFMHSNICLTDKCWLLGGGKIWVLVGAPIGDFLAFLDFLEAGGSSAGFSSSPEFLGSGVSSVAFSVSLFPGFSSLGFFLFGFGLSSSSKLSFGGKFCPHSPLLLRISSPLNSSIFEASSFAEIYLHLDFQFFKFGLKLDGHLGV